MKTLCIITIARLIPLCLHSVNMQRYQAVIFDFDGTLVNSFPWFSNVFNEVALRYRFRPVEAHEVEHLRHLEPAAIMEHLNISRWKVPFVAAHFRRLAERDIAHMHLHEGIAQSLMHLAHSGVKLGIVSSNLERNVRHVLRTDIAGRISAFGCGASLFGKGRLLQTLIRRMKVPAEECIYIGDEVRDYHASRFAGADFGGVAWGYSRPDALLKLKPDRFLTAVTQLRELA